MSGVFSAIFEKLLGVGVRVKEALKMHLNPQPFLCCIQTDRKSAILIKSEEARGEGVCISVIGTWPSRPNRLARRLMCYKI